MNLYFTADLHFGDAAMLASHPERPFSAESDVARHDEWLLDLWQRTVGPDDEIYILGDLAADSFDQTASLLSNLPGIKHLVTGNHDYGLRPFSSAFSSMERLQTCFVRPEQAASLSRPVLLSRPVCLQLCHYPLLTWEGQYRGSLMLHGHSHGRLDRYNEDSGKRRVDVGLDGWLSRMVAAHRPGGFSHAFIPFDVVYEYLCVRQIPAANVC